MTRIGAIIAAILSGTMATVGALLFFIATLLASATWCFISIGIATIIVVVGTVRRKKIAEWFAVHSKREALTALIGFLVLTGLGARIGFTGIDATNQGALYAVATVYLIVFVAFGPRAIKKWIMQMQPWWLAWLSCVSVAVVFEVALITGLRWLSS